LDIISDTDNAAWSPQSNVKTLGTFSTPWGVTRPKSIAVRHIDIDIASILELEISENIDIGDIDPALPQTMTKLQKQCDKNLLLSVTQIQAKPAK